MTTNRLLLRPDVTADDLRAMRDRARATAARAWSRYHASLQRSDPLETSNLLNSAAWEAEHWWRSLHDEVARRDEVDR